jgi:hypothetical protein
MEEASFDPTIVTTTAAAAVLQGDLLCRIVSFLTWQEMVRIRRVAVPWKATVASMAVKEQVHIRNQSVLHGLAVCLPKLESLRMDQHTELLLSPGYNNNTDNVLARFTNLVHFQCFHLPTILRQGWETDSFYKMVSQWTFLQYLNLHGCEELEWKLSDLSGLNHLKDIRCINNRELTGDVQDLFFSPPQEKEPNNNKRPTSLCHNLIILDISGCQQVTGRLSDFGPLPKLQWLGIARSQVTGDLRIDICQPGYFISIQGMGLDNDKVYGAGHIDRVCDAAAVMKARHQILQHSTWDTPLFPMLVHLSPESPEYHERPEQRLYSSDRDPPFSLETVIVGSRRGWRWSNYLGGFCDTHWLDPEPTPTNVDDDDDCCYETYRKEFVEFQQRQEASMFAGLLDPPTPQRYRSLCREREL